MTWHVLDRFFQEPMEDTTCISRTVSGAAFGAATGANEGVAWTLESLEAVARDVTAALRHEERRCGRRRPRAIAID